MCSKYLLCFIFFVDALTMKHIYADGEGAKESFTKQLMIEAGGEPVFFIVRDHVLFAEIPKGTWKKRILNEPIYRAYFDSNLEIMWIFLKCPSKDQGADNCLAVLDFREHSPTMLMIAHNVYELAYIGSMYVEKKYYDSFPPVHKSSLEWTEDPFIDWGSGEETDKDRRPLTPEGILWLKANLHRPYRKPESPPSLTLPAIPYRSHVSVPTNLPSIDKSECEYPSSCGIASPFGLGDTDLWIIEVENGSGSHGMSYESCILYESKSQRFRSPESEYNDWHTMAEDIYKISGSCGPFVFDSSGHYFFVEQDSTLLSITQPSQTFDKSKLINWL